MTAPELARLPTPRIPLEALRRQAQQARESLARWEQAGDLDERFAKRWLRRARLTVQRAESDLRLAESGLPPRCWPGVGFHDLTVGPNGMNLCRWCATEVDSKRKTFCSPLCVHEWKLRTQQGYARSCVWERDTGRCALCPEVIGKLGPWEMDHVVPVAEGGGSCGLDGLRTLCRDCHKGVTAALRKRLAARKKDSPRLGAD